MLHVDGDCQDATLKFRSPGPRSRSATCGIESALLILRKREIGSARKFEPYHTATPPITAQSSDQRACDKLSINPNPTASRAGGYYCGPIVYRKPHHGLQFVARLDNRAGEPPDLEPLSASFCPGGLNGLPFRLGRSLAGLILRDSSCLAFGRHTLGGGALPRGVGIDLGFTQRGLRPVGGFFFFEIGMWQFLWPSSKGSVPDEEHPSELRYLGNVGVISFADQLRLNLNRAPN